ALADPAPVVWVLPEELEGELAPTFDRNRRVVEDHSAGDAKWRVLGGVDGAHDPGRLGALFVITAPDEIGELTIGVSRQRRRSHPCGARGECFDVERGDRPAT